MSVIVKSHFSDGHRRTRASHCGEADLRLCVLVLGLAGVLLAAIWFQRLVPIAYLMKDPLTVVQMSKHCCHFYYGAVSNLGVVLWIATAAVCLFTSLSVATDSLEGQVPSLAAAGFLTGWLAIDDLFMIHEAALPYFGVPQPVTFAFYALATAWLLVRSRKEILASRPLLLTLSLLFLATSVVTDVVVHTESPLHVFIEDGAKFVGMLGWAVFYLAAAHDSLQSMWSPRVILERREAGYTILRPTLDA